MMQADHIVLKVLLDKVVINDKVAIVKLEREEEERAPKRARVDEAQPPLADAIQTPRAEEKGGGGAGEKGGQPQASTQKLPRPPKVREDAEGVNECLMYV